MITKKIFEDLAFSRSKGKLHLKYKNKQLAVVAESVLFQLLLDAAPASFLNDLAKVTGIKTQSEDTLPKAVVLMATVYSFERLKVLGKSPVGLSDEKVISLRDTYLADKKNVADFKKAIQVMRDSGIKDVRKFILAQVEGLKFVNNGKGVFPSVQQLGTPKALDRVFNFTASSDTSTSENKSEKPKHYWFFNKETDGSLGLRVNSKYIEAMEKIKDGTASIDAAIYAQRVFGARKGRTDPVIEAYIRKISK